MGSAKDSVLGLFCHFPAYNRSKRLLPTREPMWKPSKAEGIQRPFMLINDEIAQRPIKAAGDPADWLQQQGIDIA